jgi:hypothetical protein
MLRRVIRVVFAISAAFSGSAWGAPVTFNTALPVGDDEFVARGFLIVTESAKDPTVTNREKSSTSVVSVLGFGVTPKLAVFGVLPYVDKQFDITLGGNRISRSASGVGDMSVFARYTVLQRDEPGQTFRVAPFAGFKAPTGDDRRQDNLGILPVGVQPGSGAWDLFGGVVATYQTFDLQLDGQVSYRINNEANGFEPGNEFRMDGSLQYRLAPRTLGDGVPNFLYGVFEANLVHRDENKVGGVEDGNSGGTSLYLSPGLQYVTKRWIVEGVVQLPVAQNLGGNALENDYVIRAGFRINF